MIQLPIQPAAITTDSPVADAQPRDALGTVASIAGFRAQAAQGRAITVQSFLAQFDTAHQEEQPETAQIPSPTLLPGPVEEPTDSVDPQQPVREEGSPSGAEAWLAGMLGQAGLTVQARENPQAQSATRIAGFATQATDIRAPQPGAGTAPLAAVQPMPVGAQPDDTEPASAPAPREATQSQAQTLLQQHLASAASAPDAAAAQTPVAVPLDPRLSAADGSAPPTTSAPGTLALDKPLHLKGNDAHWGEQMVSALRDNVELQLNQRVQNATIRLDPPELGSLEILVRHEAGQLNVQISASHGDVVRMLQQTSDRLRQELVGQNFLQVNVQVSSDTQSGQSGQQNRQRFEQEQATVATNPRDAQSGERAAPRLDSDVLITV